MSDQQQDFSKHESLFRMNMDFAFPYESTSVWLQEMDISPFDLPYIQQVLLESFEDWSEMTESLSIRRNSHWAVVNHEGTWVAGDEAIHTQLEETYFELVQRCITSETSVYEGLSTLADNIEHAGRFCAVPIFSRSQHTMLAIFISILQPDQSGDTFQDAMEATTLHYRSCLYRRFEYIFVSDVMKVQKNAERESSRRSILFQIMQRMHDQIDVDTVLTEVLDSISVLYPTITLQLFMSQDHQSNNPRVKPLLFHPWGEDVSVRAFMDGKLIIQDYSAKDGLDNGVEIAIPLGGKQGVYGVFHLLLSKELREDLDLQLITMMVDTAGNAFENAKLYEQSNILIHELRLINELTQRLNQSLQLADIYQLANQELLNIFKADYCCILQYNEDRDGLEVVSSNVLSISKDVFDIDYGFGGLVYGKKEPIILSDYHLSAKVSSKLMEVTESQSLIATPLIVNGKIMGAILLTNCSPHFFSYDNYRLLQTLASHIGLSISNALLHAELGRMANRDMLTDLYARHYLDEKIQEYQGTDFCGSLIVVDIDQFKQVNDTYGHQKGDKILKKVSEIVKTSIRQLDTPARWGGEELAVYLPQLGLHQAMKVAEVIRTRVATETNPCVTVSSGIAEWNWMDEKVSVDSLFYRADMALYRAKNSGRNQIQMEDRNDRGSA
ncbi:sensor domain-containing diguanylate cyclase [Paenibacillus pini]|uniref:GGDEF/response regulator receiver domain protein n=1 Tax=Paenibacillus pini JCM 16418 TaxID=1236976 RepID=W7YF92_9BACL|nr:sensor domain-containing diguanylate cyclase [Paenibacillus pini]GAF07162.1 GGDEF/response regulator receiver domain protein [Paenibacillus pini JCM 16418]